MFRCSKCGKVTEPGTQPVVIPTGFRQKPGVPPRGERLGEQQLCPVCAKLFEAEGGTLTPGLRALYFDFTQTGGSHD